VGKRAREQESKAHLSEVLEFHRASAVFTWILLPCGRAREVIGHLFLKPDHHNRLFSLVCKVRGIQQRVRRADTSIRKDPIDHAALSHRKACLSKEWTRTVTVVLQSSQKGESGNEIVKMEWMGSTNVDATCPC
jgi:hypothetical protein